MGIFLGQLSQRVWWQLLVLTVVAGLTSLSLWRGEEFVYDDIEFVQVNPELENVRSWKDVFGYQPQATKPVANFVLASSHLLANRTVLGHRLISFGWHLLVTVLLLLNARYILRRSGVTAPEGLAFIGALLFAIHPLHTETLGIAQFRGEILAAAFSLLAIWLVLREKTLWLVSGALLLAAGSKEVYVLSLPIILALTGIWMGKRDKKFFATILFTSLAALCFLVVQMKADQSAVYTYSQRVGLNALPLKTHLLMMFRALVEGVSKGIAAPDLSILRLSERHSIADFLFAQVVFFFWVILVAVLLWNNFRKSWWWAALSVLAVGPYLIIPNINLGSEHYWYSAIGFGIFFFLSAMDGAWKRLRRQNPALPMVLLVLYGLFFSLRFDHRARELRTQATLYFAETEAFPESPFAWRALVNALLNAEAYELAKSTADEFEKISPHDSGLPLMRLGLAELAGDFEAAKKILPLVDQLEYRDRVKARLHRTFAIFAAGLFRCEEAKAALHKAAQYDPAIQLPRDGAASFHERCG